MARREDIKRDREERSRQVLALVEELGSLTAAAAQLGISKERVSQLIGKGAFPKAIEVICEDCGRAARVLRTSPPRCERCRRHLAATGQRWTPDVTPGKPRRPTRQQMVRDRMRPAPPRLELIAPANDTDD